MATGFGRAYDQVRQRKSPRSASKLRYIMDAIEHKQMGTDGNTPVHRGQSKLSALQIENEELRGQVARLQALLERYETNREERTEEDGTHVETQQKTQGAGQAAEKQAKTSTTDTTSDVAKHPGPEGLDHRQVKVSAQEKEDYLLEKDQEMQQKHPRPYKVKQSDLESGESDEDDTTPLILPKLPEPLEIEDSEQQFAHIDISFFRAINDRGIWLVGLLILQSMSSFIIKRNENLLEKHGAIVEFLTMLVGAGGNAGNQASVGVIRGLAIGRIRGRETMIAFLKREFSIGLCLSIILGLTGLIRTAIFSTPAPETVAITASLFMIVMISVLIGATLPLGMKAVDLDPAHSSTTIQVLMDILGVTITLLVSDLILSHRPLANG